MLWCANIDRQQDFFCSMEQFRLNAIPGASSNSDGSQWTANRVCQVMSPSPYLTDIGHGYSSTFNSQEIKQSLQYQHTEMNKDLSKKGYRSLSRDNSSSGWQNVRNVVRNVLANFGSAYVWYVSRSTSFTSVPPRINGLSWMACVGNSSNTMLSSESSTANLCTSIVPFSANKLVS